MTFGWVFHMPCMSCLAMQSFHDARPRGASEMDYIENDELSVSDFLDGLRYVRGEAVWRGITSGAGA
jgi:hypothetical protein